MWGASSAVPRSPMQSLESPNQIYSSSLVYGTMGAVNRHHHGGDKDLSRGSEDGGSPVEGSPWFRRNPRACLELSFLSSICLAEQPKGCLYPSHLAEV